jgi:hypothetical protein
MAESEFDGHKLLKAARDQFVRDMEAPFGERWAEFSEELCGMLFELWSRAKNGEPLPWTQREHEGDLVDHLVDLFKTHPRLRAASRKRQRRDGKPTSDYTRRGTDQEACGPGCRGPAAPPSTAKKR